VSGASRSGPERGPKSNVSGMAPSARSMSRKADERYRDLNRINLRDLWERKSSGQEETDLYWGSLKEVVLTERGQPGRDGKGTPRRSEGDEESVHLG